MDYLNDIRLLGSFVFEKLALIFKLYSSNFLLLSFLSLTFLKILFDFIHHVKIKYFN